MLPGAHELPHFAVQRDLGFLQEARACVSAVGQVQMSYSLSERIPSFRNVLLPLYSRLLDDGGSRLLRKVCNSLPEFSPSTPIIRSLFATNRHCITVKFNHPIFVTQVYVG